MLNDQQLYPVMQTTRFLKERESEREREREREREKEREREREREMKLNESVNYLNLFVSPYKQWSCEFSYFKNTLLPPVLKT